MNPSTRARRAASAAASALVLGACATIESLPPDPHLAREPDALGLESRRETAIAAQPVGDEIVVCGRRFAIGAPVVLWSDPGGYDAYRGTARAGVGFAPGRHAQPGLARSAVAPESDDPAQLARAVDQFVLHFDVCGLSRTCFKILQERKLSVHFLLDLDGTLYQTLDLRDTAWHATKANDRSIGVEIAHIGARSPGDTESLEEWYSSDSHGPYIDLPARFGDGGLRTSAFRGRPARPELVEGRINGTRLVQYDFTPEQYETLAALCRALTRVLPQIRARVPRDARGEVIEDALSDAAFRSFSGILGHYHVQTNKTDPGPAFDWERILRSSL